MNHIKYIVRAAADMILPRACVVCGEKLLLNEKHLCLYCMADLPLTRFWEIAHNPMADKFNALIQVGLEESQAQPHERYAHAAALFFFSSDAPYRHI